MADKTIPGNQSLLSILEKRKLLSPKQLKQLQLAIIQTGKDVEEIIHEKKLIPEKKFLEAKAEFLKVPYVDLEETAFDPQSIVFIPRSVAEYYLVVPFHYDRKAKELKVAMANPLDLETIEFLEKKTGLAIKPYLAAADKVKDAIDRLYSQKITAEVSKALGETEKTYDKNVLDINHLEHVIHEAPIAKVVSTILQFAVKARASDIHIEPQEGDTRVRYRVDGILQEKLILPRRIHDAVVSRIKILSNLKIDEKRVPQDGRFTFRADNEEIDVRVSTAPTVYGEKVVMRLLKKTQKIPTLPELGLRGKTLVDLREAISRPHGMIVICGPTGSGKTTTLYSILSKISTNRVNVMTIEDPVEYRINGVNQVQVNPQAGLTFSSALRSFLRQDPDIIMVGEIRDKETAQLAVEAALTGHLVFSTLHTNDAAGAAPRLIDMGVEPFLLVSALNAIVAQRVLRRIHNDCKETYKPPDAVVTSMKKALGPLWPAKEGPATLYRGKGCNGCNHTGYYGRIGVFETLPVTGSIIQLILKRAPAEAIKKQAVSEGMVTMMQDGYLKVLEGITTIEEVLRVAKY